MTNPLIAKPQDDRTPITGIRLAESAVGLYDALSCGDWIDAGVNAAGVGLDTLGMAMDPIGTLLSWGVSWVIEHCEPLRTTLNHLAGNPPVIRSYAETWNNVGVAIGHAAQEFDSAVNADLSHWHGPAADAYRTKAAGQFDAMTAAGTLTRTISAVVMLAGELVAAIRQLVRDIVANLVSYLIELIVEEALSFGAATPALVYQGSAAIARTSTEVTTIVLKLTGSLARLATRLPDLIALFAAIIRILTRRGKQPGRPVRPPIRAAGGNGSGGKGKPGGGQGSDPPDPPPSPVRNQYDSAEDAIDQAGGAVEGQDLEVVDEGPTGNAGLRAQGFTKTQYIEDADGVQWTVHYNPRTGKYTGAHKSSSNH